jgi:glycosyltransferase involved in cell wall biosynthesis
MIKMLIISRFCAYDSAGYAGSKTHNYYLKRLVKDFEVKLITIADRADEPKLDFKKYGIDADVMFIDENRRRLMFFLLFNWRNIPNHFGKTLGVVNGFVRRVVLRKLKALRKQRYCPDCILLEWTQIVLMAKDIKKIFPKVKLIASEHEVSYQRYKRQFAAAHGLTKLKEHFRYRSIQKAELKSLHLVDLIVPHSVKDRDLLIGNGISPGKIHAIVPYFTDFSEVRYNPHSTAILFFGAMDRADNYASIGWFIEHIFNPNLSAAYSLLIVGGKPHPSLDKYKSEKITVTGYIPDIRPYLAQSLCQVAPLLTGAGIKVKVIEAMSAGLPVLANGIAIEGIPAIDGIHYLHCEKPEDYVKIFDRIRNNQIDLSTLSKNAKQFIADTFNLGKSYSSYRQTILDTCRR